jgi:hypothetical protein
MSGSFDRRRSIDERRSVGSARYSNDQSKRKDDMIRERGDSVISKRSGRSAGSRHSARGGDANELQGPSND